MCLWVFFPQTRVNPTVCCDICVQQEAWRRTKDLWRTEKLAILRTGRSALRVKRLQDWQGHGKLPITGATEHAVIKMSVLRRWSKSEAKTTYRAFLSIKQQCHWFQATTQVQLKLKIWKQAREIWGELIRKESQYHKKNWSLCNNIKCSRAFAEWGVT